MKTCLKLPNTHRTRMRKGQNMDLNEKLLNYITKHDMRREICTISIKNLPLFIVNSMIEMVKKK